LKALEHDVWLLVAALVPIVPLARGRDAVRAVWAQLLSAPNLELVWTPTSVEIAQAADMAYEVGSYRLAMDGPNGRIEDDGKYVVVWRRTAAGWKVAADIFNSSRPPSS
jgi:ketosteroid isomerase-like protein